MMSTKNYTDRRRAARALRSAISRAKPKPQDRRKDRRRDRRAPEIFCDAARVSRRAAPAPGPKDRRHRYVALFPKAEPLLHARRHLSALKQLPPPSGHKAACPRLRVARLRQP